MSTLSKYVSDQIEYQRIDCQIEIRNRFAAFENLSDDKDVDRTWGNIKEIIKTSAKESLGLHELKQNKPWFDEECLGFLDRRKRAKMQAKAR